MIETTLTILMNGKFDAEKVFKDLRPVILSKLFLNGNCLLSARSLLIFVMHQIASVYVYGSHGSHPLIVIR